MFKAVEPKRRGALQDKYYKYSKICSVKRPREEWFAFDSPRIISDEIFELAQQQLKKINSLHVEELRIIIFLEVLLSAENVD